jgi:hypothetical protein
MQNKNSDCPEVCSLLGALSIKIRSCKKDLNTQYMGNVLNGMQEMSRDSAEVRDILSALSINIHICKEEPSSNDRTL